MNNEKINGHVFSTNRPRRRTVMVKVKGKGYVKASRRNGGIKSGRKFNLNIAREDQLCTLKGVGKKRAAQIREMVEASPKGVYSASQLTKLPGVSRKMAVKIWSQVYLHITVPTVSGRRVRSLAA